MSTPQLANPPADNNGLERSKRKKDKDKKRKHRLEEEPTASPMDVDAPINSKKRLRESDLTSADVQGDVVEPERKRRKKKKKRADSEEEEEVDLNLPPPPAPAASTTSGVDILKLMQNVKVSSSNFSDVLKSVGVPIAAAAHLQSAAATIESERQLARSQAPKEKPKPKSKKKAAKANGKEKKKKGKGTEIGDPTWSQVPGSEIERDENTDVHVNALTTKWHTPKELQRMVNEEGLLWKRGKFSAAEGVLIKSAIDHFCSQNNIDEDARQQLITEKGKKSAEAESFWTEITTAVPQRSLAQVYHYVKRAFHPLSRQGTWTPDEDVALLAAVGNHGQAWEKVSGSVGRTSSDCRDRYRNHLLQREKRQTGKWTPEEEKKLSKFVKKFQSESDEGEVFWTEVANKMKTRTRQQCRDKWVGELAVREKNNGELPKWTAKRRKKLVKRIAALNVNDPVLIDWSAINTQLGDRWSALLCQRQWRTLRRTVDPKLEHSHEEVVVLLQENLDKIADSEEDESISKKGRKETKRDKAPSREMVDSDEANSVDESL